MSPGWTPERAVEPLIMLGVVVLLVVLVLTLLGARLSWRRWALVGIVVLLLAPAVVVTYHQIFTNIDYVSA